MAKEAGLRLDQEEKKKKKTPRSELSQGSHNTPLTTKLTLSQRWQGQVIYKLTFKLNSPHLREFTNWVPSPTFTVANHPTAKF